MTPSGDIALVNVTKRFGTTVAVDNLNLHLPHGSYCCLLGPSGCGKTTILRLIAGHETPTAGDVRIGGASVVGLPPVQRGTAMMFQNYALFPHLTVLDNVAFHLVPARVAARGNPWADIGDDPQVLTPLLEMYDRDIASGLEDAPWPPVYPKMPGEPPRVAPSRAKKQAK